MLVYGSLILAAILPLINAILNLSSFIDHDIVHTNHTVLQAPLWYITSVWYYVLRLLENCALFVGIVKLHSFMRKSNHNLIQIQITAKQWCGVFPIILATIVFFADMAIYITASVLQLLLHVRGLQKAYTVVLCLISITECSKILSMVVVTLTVRFKWQKEVQKLKEKILAHEAKKK